MACKLGLIKKDFPNPDIVLNPLGRSFEKLQSQFSEASIKPRATPCRHCAVKGAHRLQPSVYFAPAPLRSAFAELVGSCAASRPLAFAPLRSASSCSASLLLFFPHRLYLFRAASCLGHCAGKRNGSGMK